MIIITKSRLHHKNFTSNDVIFLSLVSDKNIVKKQICVGIGASQDPDSCYQETSNACIRCNNKVLVVIIIF